MQSKRKRDKRIVERNSLTFCLLTVVLRGKIARLKKDLLMVDQSQRLGDS